MKEYSFPQGGISLEDDTAPKGDSFSLAFLPALSLIPLGRHPDGMSGALVSEGDSVREGMLVGGGKAGGPANVHASVPGTVVRRAAWEDGEGRSCEGLVVRMEGSFDRLGSGGGDGSGGVQTELMGYGELVRILDECGIVEMEGSGLPVTGMLRRFRNSGGGTVVARCVFDDPWLAADRVLCSARMDAVVEGAFTLACACGEANDVVFAVSRREKKLGEAMLAEFGERGIAASLVLTGDRYPQRNRREMELVLREYGERERRSLGSLLMLGPATLVAVYDAVMRRSPILERYVAVGGSAVRNPGVLKARIGKRIGDLFEECGGFVAPPFRVVSGSPFFGETVRYLDEPVGRTSYALVAMLAPQAGMRREKDCVSCGECRTVCPVGLDPEELYKTAVSAGLGGKAAAGPSGCHGCGCCEVVCPSGIGLASVITGGAGEEPDA